MKMEIAVLAGAESKQFLVDLTKQIDRLEALTGTKGLSASVKKSAPVPGDENMPDADEDFAPKAKKTTAATKFDDDEDAAPVAKKTAAPVEDEDSDGDFMAPPVKTAAKAKAKKLTVDDVNDACKAKAVSIGGAEGRKEVLGILKKKFKTQSVSELQPEQYAEAIAAMEV